MAKKLFTSPRGKAVYPHLNKPDTRFQAEGVYSVKLSVEPAAGADLAQKIEQAIDESVAKAKKENPGKKVKRADSPYAQEDNGNYVFNFKLKASGKTKDGVEFTQRPALFDAQGVAVKDAKIGGGSTLRVSYEMFPFYTALVGAGISLRLRAVQIIDLVEWGQASADFYGFETEEGFSVAEQQSSPFAAESESEDKVKPVDEDEAEAEPFDF